MHGPAGNPDERETGDGEEVLPTAEVAAARRVADELFVAIGPPIDAHLEAVLENCRIALTALAAQHAHIADQSDLDLDGDTRDVARWRLAGAAIAFARALVDLSAVGHVATAMPTARTLYETLGVLGVVNDEFEQTILDRWLTDREVEPRKVRAATERQARRVAADAAAQGTDLGVSGLDEQMKQMYSLLSDTSHVRRSGVAELASARLRRAIYGPHPDPRQRAAGAASTVLAVETTIIVVGDTLASFFGGAFYKDFVIPVQEGMIEQAAQLFEMTGD